MEVDVDLGGQVALVTGAGRGIGAAIARAYARSGASVVLVARTAAELEEVARGIGPAAVAAPADVTDAEAMAAAVDMAVDRFGRLDVVVANAGVVAGAFERVLEVNLTSVHALARLAEPHLRVRGGKFIVMGSGAGRRPLPAGAGYSVSKAALAMLVRCLAVEWREAGIAVNEIVPGPVRTATAAGVVGDASAMPPAIRLDWHKEPDDVAPLALFLAGQRNDGPSGQVFSLLGRDG